MVNKLIMYVTTQVNDVGSGETSYNVYSENIDLCVHIFFRVTFKLNIHNNFQLSLVDLAGSERVGKTGASADQLKVSLFTKIIWKIFLYESNNKTTIKSK